jgi:aminoglycoside 6-adenylyltransferase
VISMRSETEMMNLLLEQARRNPHVRAVLLGGSRITPRRKPDCFQDYDVAYVVDDLAPFLQVPHWADCFGTLMIRRYPERARRELAKQKGRLTNKMLFTDGVRLDLTLLTSEAARQSVVWNAFPQVLLDKDDVLTSICVSNKRDAAAVPPSADQFSKCCNAFWWSSTQVAKGLWRWEIPSAKAAMDGAMRGNLMDMLAWFVGARTGFQKDVGKHGEFLQKYLEKPMWINLLKTYSDAEREHVWESLLVMCQLFREIGRETALKLGFPYSEKEDERILDYLRQVRSLPCDAQEIFPEKKEPASFVMPQRVSSAVLLQFSAE